MSTFYGRVVDIRRRDARASEAACVSAGVVRVVTFYGDQDIRFGDIVRLDDSKVDPRLALVARPKRNMSADGDALRWSNLGSARTRHDLLRARHNALHAIRRAFDDHRFLEVETPLLAKGTCPDLHIDSLSADGGWLVTSTEYHIKRFIVGGAERVYTLTRNFRSGEVGTLHNPEFTMLEWARAHETLAEIERDAERAIRAAAHAVGVGESFEYKGYPVALDKPWERLSVRDALHKYLNIALGSAFDLESLRDAASRAGVSIPRNVADDVVDAFTWLLDQVQPHLGCSRPTFLVDWPAYLTTSAPNEGGMATRSELFIAGVEIADGFPFLTDAVEQRQLFEHANTERRRRGKPEVVLDAAYLAALEEGLPPGAGMALGVDRLLMVLLGANHIRDVIAFDWNER